MKKLLVTAIGAAAAFGASAGLISTQRFETASLGATDISSLNTLAGGNYWSGDELTNTYEIVSCAGEGFEPEEMPLGTPTKALSMKTTFGSPLTVKAIAGDNTSTNIPASGLYFDSLVKFTVCEEAPEQTYKDAKIIMWLEEEYASDGDTILGTNIMVRASYVNADGTCTPTNFVCYTFDGDIDAWHRVTIKTWADITNGSGIPGFAIFIDNELVNVAGSETTMADAFVGNLTEAAGYFGPTKVFASLVQGEDLEGKKFNITSASFDGTGKLTDLVFTDEAPFDAAKDHVKPQAAVTINGEPIVGITTLAQAVGAVNDAIAGQTVTFSLQKGMTLDEALVFDSPANVTFDFAGFVLTNAAAYCAITNKSGAITFVDSGIGGGITCTDHTAGAIHVSGGTSATIAGGTFRSTVKAVNWGTILLAKIVHITGGSFEVKDGLEARATSEGKMFKWNEATSLYDVVDAKYTVIFVSGINGQITNKYDDLSVGAEMPTPPDASIAGKNYVWEPEVADTVTGDATYTAMYTDINYTIKFVYGLQKEATNTIVATYYQSVSEPTGTARDGYTLAWTPAIQDWPITVTHDETYEATYTPIEYTITYKEPDGAAFTRWASAYSAPASFTVASAETLPVAANVDLGTGATFNNWTNAAGTVVSTTAGLTADLVVFANLTPVVAPTYPSYIDTSDTTVKNQYDAWKTTYSVSDGQNDLEKYFLLNTDPKLGMAQLTSTDVAISGTTVTINLNYGNLNGYAYVKKAATLEGLKNAVPSPVQVVPADNIENGGRVTLTSSGDAQFYQIGVQSAPVAVPNP